MRNHIIFGFVALLLLSAIAEGQVVFSTEEGFILFVEETRGGTVQIISAPKHVSPPASINHSGGREAILVAVGKPGMRVARIEEERTGQQIRVKKFNRNFGSVIHRVSVHSDVVVRVSFEKAEMATFKVPMPFTFVIGMKPKGNNASMWRYSLAPGTFISYSIALASENVSRGVSPAAVYSYSVITVRKSGKITIREKRKW